MGNYFLKHRYYNKQEVIKDLVNEALYYFNMNMMEPDSPKDWDKIYILIKYIDYLEGHLESMNDFWPLRETYRKRFAKELSND